MPLGYARNAHEYRLFADRRGGEQLPQNVTYDHGLIVGLRQVEVQITTAGKPRLNVTVITIVIGKSNILIYNSLGQLFVI